MPPDFSISLAAKGGTERLLVHPGTERRQSMRGFEETYVDIIDYIVRITHRIWEEKDIGYIYDTYRHNSKVQDGTGLQYGRDKIVADTVHNLTIKTRLLANQNGCPDRGNHLFSATNRGQPWMWRTFCIRQFTTFGTGVC